MRITVKVIPHEEQRYPTVGDWWWTPTGALEVRVSALGDPRMEDCVAVHELVEALLCGARGVKEEAVTNFDIAFEQRRKEGEVDEDAEPGDDKAAPYHREHQFATVVEKMLAREFGLDWRLYTDTVNAKG